MNNYIFENIDFDADNEFIITVDENDRITGKIKKYDAHINGATLHRAFSLFILKIDEDGASKLLMQQRSQYKPLFGLYWSNTVCSHPSAIQSEENGDQGNRVAVHRKTLQELNLDLTQECINNMVLVNRIIYSATYSDILTERELDYVYVLKVDSTFQNTFNYNKDEVNNVKWVSLSEMDSMIEMNVVSPWCEKIYKNFFRNLWINFEFNQNQSIIKI